MYTYGTIYMFEDTCLSLSPHNVSVDAHNTVCRHLDSGKKET